MLRRLALSAVLLMGSSVALAAPEIGKEAPAFSVKDANGKERTLEEFKDKWVVLEWFNKGCPFVQKHYGSKNMQDLQKKYTKKGVIWLTVISSAKGEQGHVDGKTANEDAVRSGASPSAILLDEEGKVGRSYGAKTTPHMFIISPQKKVVYMGAIDSISSTSQESLKEAKNYIDSAFVQLFDGKPIAEPVTQQYGCTIKYKS